MKTFVCWLCMRTFNKVDGYQPVKTTRGGMCQHCWSQGNWGKKWADTCQAEHPETGPIVTVPKLR